MKVSYLRDPCNSFRWVLDLPFSVRTHQSFKNFYLRLAKIFRNVSRCVKENCYNYPCKLIYLSIWHSHLSTRLFDKRRDTTLILPLEIIFTLLVTYQSLPRMVFLFHLLYVMIKFTVCIQTFYSVTVFWVLNYCIKDF